MSKHNSPIHPGIKKYILIIVATLFIFKLFFILGDDFKSFKNVSEQNPRIYHVKSIPKEKIKFYEELREEVIDNLRNGKPLKSSVITIRASLRERAMLDDKSRHESLLLATSMFLSIRDYVIDNSIKYEQYNELKSLLKEYENISYDIQTQGMHKKGYMFILGRDEVLSFLSESWGNDMMEKEKLQKDLLRENVWSSELF